MAIRLPYLRFHSLSCLHSQVVGLTVTAERKEIIIIGLFLFGVSELIFGVGTNVSVFYLSRILGGISAAFIMPGVTAYVADITSVQERPKAMGYISAAISSWALL